MCRCVFWAAEQTTGGALRSTSEKEISSWLKGICSRKTIVFPENVLNRWILPRGWMWTVHPRNAQQWKIYVHFTSGALNIKLSSHLRIYFLEFLCAQCLQCPLSFLSKQQKEYLLWANRSGQTAEICQILILLGMSLKFPSHFSFTQNELLETDFFKTNVLYCIKRSKLNYFK